MKIVYKGLIYIELADVKEAGVDLEEFLKETGGKLKKDGRIRINQPFRESHVKRILHLNGLERYYLDPKIFDSETDLGFAFKVKSPL